jgi:hypothetical protein
MIDLSKLIEADRGRIMKVIEEELGSTQEVVLVSWNKKFAFIAWMDSSPPAGGYIDPDLLTFTEGRAILAYRYGMQFRPCSIGAQPRGFIPDPTLMPPYGQPDWQNPKKRFGCLDYPEKLSDKDIKAYELHYFGPVWRAFR